MHAQDAPPNPHVVIETTMGDITIELFRPRAPVSTVNFLTYALAGYYDGTIFHRVIRNLIIQGGGVTPDHEPKTEGLRAPILNEATNNLQNRRGSVAMARLGTPNSARAQFFINVGQNMQFNHRNTTPAGFGYAVFGEVVDGMDVVDDISRVSTAEQKGQNEEKLPGMLVACAGTSDLPVALEACITGEMMGCEVTRMFDVGVAGIHRLFDKLDILVNNAGYLRYTQVSDCSEEEWDKQININLKGMFFCSQVAINHMIERKQGVILSMSSLAAKNGGLAASAPYAAAKGAIFTLTITLARFGAPHGVRVNALAPGVIDTPMTRGLSSDHANLSNTIPLGEKGQPEDVAACALFLASDDARHITGETVDVNGGLFMD